MVALMALKHKLGVMLYIGLVFVSPKLIVFVGNYRRVVILASQVIVLCDQGVNWWEKLRLCYFRKVESSLH